MPSNTIMDQEEWNRKLQQIRVTRSDMDEIIMNFLLIEGYKEPALAFSRETGIKRSI